MYQGIIGVERGFTAPKGPPQKDFGTGLIYFNARYYDPELGTFISPDTIVPDATNLFAYNRYMYVAGNPLRLTDSSGHVWETVVDAVSVGYGIYDIYQNGLNWENGTSLAVDVVSTAVPFMPAPGACVRWCDDAVQYGDDAWQWGKNKADDAWRWATGKGDEVADGAKAVDNIPCPNSFSGDTLVMTAGGAKPIAELVEGDIVLAYNEATGKVGPYPIVDTISHVDPTIVLLTIDGELIETTAGHPFYELESAPWLAVGQTEGRWTDALDLRAGDRVWKADGTSGVVQSVAVAPVPQRMYNLTVAEAHTFFVGDGQWLVHNCNPSYPKDFATKNTKNWSAQFNSERDARALAREKLGKNPVEVEPNKWRSQDGKWQYRAKPGDLEENHLHLEELNPTTGEVLQNLHLRWK